MGPRPPLLLYCKWNRVFSLVKTVFTPSLPHPHRCYCSANKASDVNPTGTMVHNILDALGVRIVPPIHMLVSLCPIIPYSSAWINYKRQPRTDKRDGQARRPNRPLRHQGMKATHIIGRNRITQLCSATDVSSTSGGSHTFAPRISLLLCLAIIPPTTFALKHAYGVHHYCLDCPLPTLNHFLGFVPCPSNRYKLRLEAATRIIETQFAKKIRMCVWMYRCMYACIDLCVCMYA